MELTRKCLNLKDKYDIVNKIKSGSSQVKIVSDYEIAKSNVSSIVKNSKLIIEQFLNFKKIKFLIVKDTEHNFDANAG